MIVEVLLLLVGVLLLTYYQLTKNNDYWKKRGVKYMEPRSIFTFFADLLFRKGRIGINREVYAACEGERFIGTLQIQTPALFIRDPELIRCVLGKDFAHFHDRGIVFDEKKEKLSAHLFNVEGARWRNLRTKLTPTFTSGKMKNMFPFMEECAQEMMDLLGPHAEKEDIIEMREIFARYTTDVIGTCAFGVQCNSLKNPDAEFRKMGALSFKVSWYTTFVQFMRVGLPLIGNLLPRPTHFKTVNDFFFDAIMQTVKFREANNVVRHDFLDLLMQIKKKGTIVSNTEDLKDDAFVKDMGDMKIEHFEFTDSLMAAQAFVFFLAGFETSSTTLSFAMIELSKNPEIQEKLREEIDAAFKRHGNKFTYDAIMEMPYLDKVVSETLRMYPPLHLLFRSVTQPYKIPDTEVVLEKNVRVLIPLYAMHHDPEIYPDPETFDPERFTEEEKQKRHKYVYLPFGEGPRNCIGLRFGLLQTKLALATLLHKYQFELGPEMEYPPVFSKTSFLLALERGNMLRIKFRAPLIY